MGLMNALHKNYFITLKKEEEKTLKTLFGHLLATLQPSPNGEVPRSRLKSEHETNNREKELI